MEAIEDVGFGEVDEAELNFLVLHHLHSLGVTSVATEAFEREALEHGLLPRRYDAFGSSHPQTYEECRERYAHVEPNHLLRLMRRLSGDTPQGRQLASRGVTTLVGVGTSSLVTAVAVNQSGARAPSGPLEAAERRLNPNPDRPEAFEESRATLSVRKTCWPYATANFRDAERLRQIFGRARDSGLRNRKKLLPTALMGSRVNPLCTFRGHRKELYCVIFDKTGRRAITGSDDTLVKIWSAETGLLLHACRGHTGEIAYLDVNASNELVASGSFDYTIRTWFLETGAPAAVLLGHGDIVSECRFCPTVPRVLISTSWDGTIRVWDAYADSMTSPPLILDLKPAGEGGGGSGAGSSFGGVQITVESVEEQAQAAASGTEAARTAQTAAAAAAAQGIQPDDRDAPPGGVICAAWSPSGKFFACGTTMCKSHVWSFDVDAARATAGVPDPAMVREMPKVGGHLHDIVSCNFSHSGELLVTASRDGQAKIWAWSASRSSTASSAPRTVSDGKSWKLQRVLTTSADAEALRQQARARRAPVVYAMEQAVWTLDDRTVVAAMSDFTIRVWEAASGMLTHTLRLHTNKVHVVQCHPHDPRLLFTAGHDGRVAVWDINTGQCVRVHDSSQFDTLVLDGSWSPDGSRIVVSDEKGQWCVFGTGSGEALQRAKYEQFFAREFLRESELTRDAAGRVSLATDPMRPLHTSCADDKLMDSLGNPYAEPYQSAFQSGRLAAANVPARVLFIEPPIPVTNAPLPVDRISLDFRAAAMLHPDADEEINEEMNEEMNEESGEEESGDEVQMFSGETDSEDAGLSEEDEEEQVSDSDFAMRRHIRRRGSPAFDDDTGRAANVASGGGIGRAERANRRALEREERAARRLERHARNTRRSNRARRAPRRLVVSDEEISEEDEHDEYDLMDRRTTGRRRMQPERFGVVPHDGSEEDEEDHANNPPEERSALGRTQNIRVRFTMKRAREDEVGVDGAGPSHRRRADEDSEIVLPRESYGRASAAAPSGMNGALRNIRSHESYGWLQQDSPRLGAYIPQMGDALVYIPQGHAEFLDSRNNKAASKPWNAISGMRNIEPVRVVGLNYIISQDGRDETVANLRLRLADPSAASPGAEFEVELPRLDDPDFLVPLHRYRAAAEKAWRVDDRCAVLWQEDGVDGIKVDSWWHGVVSAMNPNSGQWQGSPWNSFLVEYYNVTAPEDKTQAHSCWELYDEDVLRRIRDGTERVDADTPTLDRATVARLMDRVRRALAKLEYDAFTKTIGSEVSFPQVDGSRVNYCSLVPLPMALDLILNRLASGYYRQVEAFKHDLATLRGNCELFNGDGSEYTTSAVALERELCENLQTVDIDRPIVGVEPASRVPPPVEDITTPRGRRRR